MYWIDNHIYVRYNDQNLPMNRLSALLITFAFALGALSGAEPPLLKTKETKQAYPRILSAKEANQFVMHKSFPEYPLHARSERKTGSGVYLMRVQPGGRVSSVVILKSTGWDELDRASMNAFAEWRFKPGAVKAVKIPVTFSMRREPY